MQLWGLFVLSDLTYTAQRWAQTKARYANNTMTKTCKNIRINAVLLDKNDKMRKI